MWTDGMMERPVTSLQKLCVQQIARNLDHYIGMASDLPIFVRAELLKLACKRGVISDENVQMVSPTR